MDTSYLEYALKQHGLTPPYGEEQFERAMESYAIDHNSVINAFTY